LARARRLRGRALDAAWKALLLASSLLAMAPLAALLASVVSKGSAALAEAGLGFFTKLPPTPLSKDIGGIAPALVGSLVSSSLALATAFPAALLLAFFAVEFSESSLSKLLDAAMRAFLGAPTVVLSMFVYLALVVPTKTQSVAAASVALALAALPYAYVYASAALRSVPPELREAAASLGMTRIQALRNVYLGAAKRYVASGALTTFLRALGDTAPLLFTMGFLTNAVFSGLAGPGNAIPLLVFVYGLTPYEVLHKVAWGASLVLVLIAAAVVLARELAARVEEL